MPVMSSELQRIRFRGVSAAELLEISERCHWLGIGEDVWAPPGQGYGAQLEPAQTLLDQPALSGQAINVTDARDHLKHVVDQSQEQIKVIRNSHTGAVAFVIGPDVLAELIDKVKERTLTGRAQAIKESFLALLGNDDGPAISTEVEVDAPGLAAGDVEI